jgi:NCS1 family nucleobase:cation symporter-1
LHDLLAFEVPFKSAEVHLLNLAKMTSLLVRRFKDVVPATYLQAKAAQNVHGKDIWLDNDDIRPLKLADRTWNLWTYLTFWFSASE